MLTKILRSISAAMLILATFDSPAALAGCATDTDSQWECLEIDGIDVTTASTMAGPHTFSGDISLYHSLTGTLDCTWTWTAGFDVDPGADRLYIDMTGAEIAMDCPGFSFGSADWQVYEALDGMPGVRGGGHGDVHDKHGSSHNTLFDLANFEFFYETIFASLTMCSGTLAHVVFGNDVNGSGDKDNPSFFRLNGSVAGCTISGTLTTDGYIDVNAW